MSLISTPYFEITCNAQIDNIRHPNCPAVSPGGFDQEDVVKRALGLGWTEHGRGHRCRGCSGDSFEAAPPVAARKARQPRPQFVPNEQSVEQPAPEQGQ